MSMNLLNSAEWPDIVRRIRSGDPNIGAYLAERESRLNQFFGRYGPWQGELTQEGGQVVNTYTGGWELSRFGPQVIGVFSATWDTITPGVVTGTATTPVISVTLPQGFNVLAPSQAEGVGMSWFANDNVLSYYNGGVTFNGDHVETFPADVAYTTPPTLDLTDLTGLTLLVAYRIPDALF